LVLETGLAGKLVNNLSAGPSPMKSSRPGRQKQRVKRGKSNADVRSNSSGTPSKYSQGGYSQVEDPLTLPEKL